VEKRDESKQMHNQRKATVLDVGTVVLLGWDGSDKERKI
jgi:hypothetical protein